MPHGIGKRNDADEKEILQWIGAVIEEPFPANAKYEDALRDGIALCKLMNKLSPGAIKLIQTSGGKFKLMENIQRFQEAARAYGVPDDELFQPVDLCELRNLPQVTLSLYALARITQKHPEYKGPHLGPKMSDKHERHFTEEQLRAGEGHIGLQAGYNKGANQSGINMGKGRSILD